MSKLALLLTTLCLHALPVKAQQIVITEMAPLEQSYGEKYESGGLLPMNDLDMELGYVLYEAVITLDSPGATLVLENVRDYAAVYVDGVLCGSLTDNRKSVVLDLPPGEHTLQLYAENIGRITYGPEILDNYKGLFGEVSLEGGSIGSWTMIPLYIRDTDVGELVFGSMPENPSPGFYRGHFDIDDPADIYLDISGWGMGEVWINGRYSGSFWEEEKQQSIMIPGDILTQSGNEVIIFELKNNGARTLRLSPTPVFL